MTAGTVKIEESLEIFQGFEIEIADDVKDRIKYLTNEYELEISAFLAGEILEKKIKVDKLLFPEQDVSIGSVDTDGEQLIKLRKEYGDECKRIIGHWHSHNKMKAFWSLDDEKFINEFMEVRDIRLFLVSSRDDGIRARLEMRKPINIGIDGLKIKEREFKKELIEEMKDTINKKIKESKPRAIREVENVFDILKKQHAFEGVELVKREGNVRINRASKGLLEKVDGIFKHDMEIKRNKDNTVDLTFVIKDKKKAREFREELKETLESIVGIGETYSGIQYPVSDEDYWADWERRELLMEEKYGF